MSEILRVEHVNAYYKKRSDSFLGKSTREQVLHDVSLTVEEGEIHGIVGESGCGKTTLAKVILGINPQYDGNVIVAPGSRPQMIFQDPYGSLNPARKVGWIMEEPLRLNTKDNRQLRREKVLTMLERVGLSEEIAGRYPSQLSGGQRQRVGIATALMLEPKLLIADEPLSALDVTIQAQVAELLQKLQKEMGLSVLLISHDLRMVYNLCKKISIMEHGRVIESGKVDDIYFAPAENYTKELLEAAGICYNENND